MLHLHRSERADRLVVALADVLAEPPGDPFAVDVVAVPAKGVERWLAQRLSHVLGAGDAGTDGVCAHVRFPHPSVLVAESLAAVAAVSPDDDPWAPGRLLWTVLDVIDECASEPWCRPLGGHLGVGAAAGSSETAHRRGRRLSTAQHLVRLFDAYAAHRPSLIRDWAADNDGDGIGGALDHDTVWQAELWRRVRARVGVPSPAERLEPACALLREQPGRVDLPARLSVFGPTRLSTAQLAVLAALAEQRDVHLWLPHPSPVLWARLAEVADATPRAGHAHVRRADDPSGQQVANPLLASLGRDARELQLQLASLPAADHHHPSRQRPATLLGALQEALQQDQAAAADAHDVGSDDRSLQVHACHGAARQVEVLRDVIVGLLAQDATLEPRDVLVMCPDIEGFAPLISATFGAVQAPDDDGGDIHPGHQLRVRLADRSLRQTNPLLDTLATLLELAGGRLTASEVLDLAASPPVRRKFRFSDDDLDRLRGWIVSSGVRWGIDAEQRKAFGLEQVRQNTWSAGLDRILLGAAMAEDDLRWLGLALPLDDVDSSDIDLAGRLAELLDRLGTVLQAMAGEQPLSAWLDHLLGAVDTLTDVPPDDAWQSAQVRRELSDIAHDAGATSPPLSLADVHALLAERLQGRPTRANFRTGSLTVCSMVPMRSVPHRVVCLLGLDDGSFPRQGSVDGDDILAREPCVGERDPRSEDRQLLLDAVLAAGETLVLLYSGADPRTNAARPPAVPVSEILDAADALARTDDGTPARQRLVTHHPLQPFDARNFVPGALGTHGPFSFDVQAARGAESAALPRRPVAELVPRPLPAAPDDAEVELLDLVSFVEHPVRAFLRQRVGVTLLHEEAELDDELCIGLSALEQWAVGDRLLRSRLSGIGADACRQAEWRRGTLPPGELGRRVVDSVMTSVEPLIVATSDLRAPAGRAVDISADLTDPGTGTHRRLTGTVSGLHADVVVRTEFSRLGPRHRLRAWVQVLALSTCYPDREWAAVTIGRAPRGQGVLRSTIGPVAAASAARHLSDLLALRALGLRTPLPLAAKASEAYAAKRSDGMSEDNALAVAANVWAGRYPEYDDEAFRMVWREDSASFETLLGLPPPAGVADAVADEATWFGRLARRLWQPLLDAENLS